MCAASAVQSILTRQIPLYMKQTRKRASPGRPVWFQQSAASILGVCAGWRTSRILVKR